MVVTRFLVLALTIVIFVGMIAFGVTLYQKVKSESGKSFISRYLVVVVIAFAAGGMIRMVQQNTGYAWLNGFVPIFGGIFLLLLGLPLIWRNRQNKFNILIRSLFFLLGLLIMFLGLSSIYLGITQIWEAFLTS